MKVLTGLKIEEKMITLGNGAIDKVRSLVYFVIMIWFIHILTGLLSIIICQQSSKLSHVKIYNSMMNENTITLSMYFQDLDLKKLLIFQTLLKLSIFLFMNFQTTTKSYKITLHCRLSLNYIYWIKIDVTMYYCIHTVSYRGGINIT